MPLPPQGGGLFAPLVASGTPTPEAIAAFLAQHRFPVAEPGAAIFAWTGEADRVELVRWLNAHNERLPLQRVAGTALWLLRLPVRDHGRFEYKLAVIRGSQEEWVLDPLNPVRTGSPFGENSVCRTLGYRPPAWTRPRGAPAGRLVPVRVPSATFAETRAELAYLPAGHDPARAHPLLVVHDGRDFARYGGLTVALDNLIAAGTLPPLVALLIQAGDRAEEYPHARRHARYVVRELLPAAAATFALPDSPHQRVLLGASLGAVAALATAHRYPGVFGGLVLQSGAFILDEGKLATYPRPPFRRVARLVRALRRAPALPPTRVYVSTGELEGLAADNRRLAGLLRRRGAALRFRSTRDGHHWHNWRNQLREALAWVLGGAEDQ